MNILTHVGFHKTGTTWLQQEFFEKNPNFRVLARHYVVDSIIVQPNWFEFDPHFARKKLINNISSEDIIEKNFVISSEILSGNPFFGGRESDIIAKRVKCIFPATKILITIRNQVDVLRSLYKQYVSRGGTMHFRNFFFPRDYLGHEAIGYYYFNSNYYRYHNMVELYYNLFGQENVLVLLYEDLKNDTENFCDAIYKFALSCKESEDFTYSKNVRGRSVSDYAVNFVRFFNYYKKTPFHYQPLITSKFCLSAIFKTIFFVDNVVSLPKRYRKSSNLNNFIQENFTESYRESNAILSKMINRDLSSYGYPT